MLLLEDSFIQKIETLYQCAKFIFHKTQGSLHHFDMFTFFGFLFANAIIIIIIIIITIAIFVLAFDVVYLKLMILKHSVSFSRLKL